MARRLVSALVCGALLAASCGNASPVTNAVAPISTSSPFEIKNVLLRESEGYHDEVWAPFLADLASSPFIRTTFSRHYHRWNMPNITDRIPFVNTPNLRGFGYKNKAELPLTPEDIIENMIDYLLTVSCDADFYWRPAEYQRLFHQTTVKLLCVDHDTHNFAGAVKQYSDVTKLWIDSNRITFLVLSEHVGRNLQKQMIKRGSKPIDYEVYIPVMDLPKGIETDQAEVKQKAFVIQGNFESGRRDYNKVFQHLREGLKMLPAGTPASEKPKLVLIGSGKKLEIPKDLTAHVDMHMNLEYPEFYKTLSRSAVLLPAFGSPQYYTEKASSTINAAIIGGTVIIGNQTMLDSYTFLDDKIVFSTQPGESDVQAAMRYLSLDKTTRNNRLQYIREYRHKTIRKNRALLERLINPEAVARYEQEHRTTKEVMGQYLDAATAIPVDHPRSSGAGFAVMFGVIVAIIFRRPLVREYRKLRLQFVNNDVPVSMSHS